MTKAKKGPAKVSGAVLIMILAVMTVLIILLAGSIAVVYSTHQRVAVKYQESQAYYTMRSTLEACLNNLIMSKDKDNTTTSMTVYYYTGETDPIQALSGGGAKKLERGRYEELVLYQVPVSTETNDSNPNFNQWYKKNLGTLIKNDSAVNITDSELNGAGITDSDFTNFKKQYAAPKWNSSTMQVGVDDTITYTIDLNSIAQMAVNDSGETITRMLDNGLNDTAIVKLQVLERQYDLGGSDGDDPGMRFILGKRNKDYFRVKVTCEIHIDGELQTYSIFYSTKQPVPQVNGVSSLSKMNPGSKIRMINEANSLENTNYYFTNNSVTTGNVTLFGNLNMTASGCEFALQKNDVFLVKEKFTGDEYSTGIIFAETGAVLYCKEAFMKKPFTCYTNMGGTTANGTVICSGKFSTNNQSGFGKIRLIADTFEYTDSNPPSNKMFDSDQPDAQSYFNDVKITITNNPGNWYTVDETNKKITLKENFMKVLGDCNISRSIIIVDSSGSETQYFVVSDRTKDPYEATKYTIACDSGAAVTSVVTGVNKYENPEMEVSVDYDSAPIKSNFAKEISLPGVIAGRGHSKKLEVKTQRSIFKDRFEETGTDGTPTWNADGTFVATDQAFLWAHLKSRETVPAATAAYASGTGVPGISGATVSIPWDPSVTDPAKASNIYFDSVITKNSGVLELKGAYSGNILFDTTDGDINVVFNDYVKGKFYVKGDNILKIYVTSPDGTFDLGGTDHEFLLVDFNTLNVNTKGINTIAGEQRGPRTTIYVCDDASGNRLVKTMTMYKLDSAGVNGLGPVVCAQIDAPKTDFVFNSSGGMNIAITLSSGYTLQTIPIAVMGSVFTNSFQSGEDRGIWSMVPPEDPNGKQVNLYARYR